MDWTNQGGYLTNNQLTMMFQKVAQPLMRFRPFVTPEPKMGVHKGEKVSWLQVSNLDDPGGELDEDELMHETNQGLAWNDATVRQYGNSVPFTFKVQTLSEFDIKNIIRQGLLDDYTKVTDCLIERQFNATPLHYTGTAASGGELLTTGAASATNNSELNLYHLEVMVDALKDRNVPGYADAGGDYVLIGGIKAIRNLKRSMQSINQYTESGYKKIVDGEVGRIDGVRIVEDRQATKYTYDATARTFTAITWTNGLSGPAYLFGSPTVREVVVVPEEIRAKEPTNYGLSHGLAWFFLGAYKIEWTGAANARIIKWDSAA
jgi:N4-gp56 family major capsid protein